MSKIRSLTLYAKAVLGKTGNLNRVASCAEVFWNRESAEWVVTALDSTSDGGIFSTAFSGPLARERAVEYAVGKYSGYRIHTPISGIKADRSPTHDSE